MCVINKFHVRMPQTPRRYVFTAKIPQKLSFAKSAICKETWKIISETLAQNQNPLYFCTRFREGTTLKPKRKRENKRPERGFDARREIFENICNLRGRTGHIEIYVNTRGSYKAQDLRETKKNNSYNGEFDPGSGWTLARGLTHASRGVTGELAPADDRRTGE